jgi:hypothetical protein
MPRNGSYKCLSILNRPGSSEKQSGLNNTISEGWPPAARGGPGGSRLWKNLQIGDDQAARRLKPFTSPPLSFVAGTYPVSSPHWFTLDLPEPVQGARKRVNPAHSRNCRLVGEKDPFSKSQVLFESHERHVLFSCQGRENSNQERGPTPRTEPNLHLSMADRPGQRCCAEKYPEHAGTPCPPVRSPP